MLFVLGNNAFKRGCFGCKASSFCLVAGNSTCRPDSEMCIRDRSQRIHVGSEIDDGFQWDVIVF